MEKPVKLKIVNKNADGSLSALVDEGEMASSNGGGSMMMPKYRAKINGINVYFDSEADLLKADQMVREMGGMGDEDTPELGRGGARMMRRGGGVGARAGFLRTGADVAQTVGAFLAGRGLRNKRDDLDRTMADFDDARSQLDALQKQFPDLVPVLGRIFDRLREEQVTSISILDDEILALDVAAGAGLADTVDDFWGGSSDTRSENFGPAIAVGGLGLGLGLYLSNRNNRRRGRR